MMRRTLLLLTAMLAMAQACAADKGGRAGKGFQFGVIGHPFKVDADEGLLKRAIAEVNQDKPVFIVATGIKAEGEPCSDKLYGQRREILNDSPRPLIVSPAGSDWSECRNSLARSNAVERLNRIREVFYPDNQSLGVRRIELTRLSATAKFRSYAENAHWEHGGVLFATLNLPADNNRYLQAAGRNGEYEDRLVANRAWLHRLFAMAQRRALAGVVLFSDGDIGVHTEDGFSLLNGFSARKDGFAPVRKQVRALAEKFKGKVLLVDSQGDPKIAPAIVWKGNLGHLGLGTEWEVLRVEPGGAQLFVLKDDSAAP